MKTEYAITLGFNEEFKTYFKENYARFQKDEIEPHITLAFYQQLSINEFLKQFETFVCNKARFSLNFETIGTFSNNGTLFLAPVINDNLWNLHQEYHQFMNKEEKGSGIYYRINHWVPHCTIVNRLPQNQLVNVFNEITKDFKPKQAVVTSVNCIELFYNQNKLIRSRLIKSYELQ